MVINDEIKIIIFQIAVILFLGAGALMDVKTKSLPGKYLIAGLGSALFLQVIANKNTIWEIVLGIALGAVMILIGKLSREAIGYGDGILFMVTGILLGGAGNLILLMIALFAAAFACVVLMVIKKFKKKQTLPFVPFVLGGYVLMLCFY